MSTNGAGWIVVGGVASGVIALLAIAAVAFYGGSP